MQIDYQVSRNFSRSHFPEKYKDWKVEDKIKLFIDKVKYWQLDIADKLINGYTIEEKTKIPSIPHSGYATLSILSSYFEMFGKYYYGFIPEKTDYSYKRQSGRLFKKGFDVIAEQLGWISNISPFNEKIQRLKALIEKHLPSDVNLTLTVNTQEETLGKAMYEEVRCALYHIGSTSGKIRLSSQFPTRFIMITNGNTGKLSSLDINPHHLTKELLKHIDLYSELLLDDTNTKLRSNFEKRFDFDVGYKT